MLTKTDIEFIKGNRAEITENRTEIVTLIRASGGVIDPYTGEQAYEEATETVSVIWKEVSTVANSERDVVNGVELQQGDVQVTFEATINLSTIISIERAGIKYVIVTIDERGIGEVNRRECIVRRAT